MRILIVHQHFLREGEGGGSRFNQLAKYWAERGHKVTVLASLTHYSTGKARVRRTRSWREQGPTGVDVLRCPTAATSRLGFLGRIWSFLSFALSATWAGLFIAGKHDVVLASSPPLFVAIPGYIVSRLRRIPFVFEVRDLWPDFAVEMGILRSQLLIKLSYGLERFAYRKATRVNVLTPAFREELTNRGVPSDKIFMIPNGADLDLIHPGERDNWVRERYGWGDDFVVIYTGAHGKANALHQLLDAVDYLPERRGIRIVLVGDGSEKHHLEERVKLERIDEIEFIPPQSKEMLGDFLAAADVCVAVLADVPGFRQVYPNKLFDYMASARPTILGISGVAKKLLEEAEAGVAVEPERARQIATAILYLMANPALSERMGQRGREYVIRRYDRKDLALRYERELKRLVEGSVR